jgi:hypothetical protein
MRQARSRFFGGIVAGVLAGALLVFGPVISFGLIAAIAIATLALPPRPAALAGVLLGGGFVYLFGAIRTAIVCLQTDTFCGQANLTPFTLVAIALVTVGSAVAVTTVLRIRRA